ncbi:MAG TPA: orotidine-5'-phosphate decarboxylase [Actinomycetota bacterium]|nr:orotidine-5'-phosphate decarboxylase [Actinomycetota bacterium]
MCVALDSLDAAEVERVARAVAPHAGMLKLGLGPFVAHGGELARAVASLRPLFIDLKLHDIPAQVEGAARAAARLGARCVTVHAAGGSDMVRAAVEGAGDDTAVLAVTVLTSLDDSALAATGVASPARDQVVRLAELALRAGAAGLVCSPLEVAELRARLGAAAAGGPALVVPGIRPPGSAPDDQRRTLGPRDALDAGADVLVVGRPVTGAPDPGAAARALAADLER